jgi:hypothetical protein
MDVTVWSRWRISTIVSGYMGLEYAVMVMIDHGKDMFEVLDIVIAALCKYTCYLHLEGLPAREYASHGSRELQRT